MQILLMFRIVLSSVSHHLGATLGRFCCALTEPFLAYLRRCYKNNVALYLSIDVVNVIFSAILALVSCVLIVFV